MDNREKISSIIETSTLSEQECNEYCRKHGLYKAELESWKVDFIKGSDQKVTQATTDKKELKQLRSENNIKKRAATQRKSTRRNCGLIGA